MPHPTSRRHVCTFDRLEPRSLLSLAGLWLGQDGSDLVGGSSLPGPDDVQDVHIRLTGLPTERSIAFLDISGYGGGNWQFNGPYGPWRAEVVRLPGSTLADVYFAIGEPETGRSFQVTVKYDNGAQDIVWMTGGTADPNLRMPYAQLLPAWIGQDGSDRTGTGIAVGPDGAQDVRLELQRLSASIPIDSVIITASDGRVWSSGINPDATPNAEFLRRPDDTTRGDLFFQPAASLAGQSLTIQVRYAGGRIDQAVLTPVDFNPALRVAPAAAFPTIRSGFSTVWIGQDGGARAGLGSARLTLSGLPPGRQVQGAVLSNSIGSTWIFRAPGALPFLSDPDALPLAWQMEPGSTSADLAFVPIRDEANSLMTLRILFDDGSMGLVSLTGGPTDPTRAAPTPPATSITARPGDNLQELVNNYGTVFLAPGIYPLSTPLILNRAVNLVADRSGPVTLLFSQPTTAPNWSSAIKIHAGNSTLSGFSVRFTGPVRWDWNTPFGPAVIGTSEPRDGAVGTIKVGLQFDQLDLESPPAESAWEEAPRLINLASALNGQITNNTLRGGSIEFFRGPWLIQNNNYRGTPPSTYSWSVLSGHSTHDLQILQNHAEPVGTSGKTWRFLVLTTRGANDLIARNAIIGIGPRDSDSIHENANEIILTESYRLKFEGRPLALSSDGRIVRLPTPQGEPVQAGDLLAVLDGPDAGSYRRILQVLDATTCLLDQPVHPATSAISITAGFVNAIFDANLIDSRGSSAALNLVLVGNHFGTQITNNHLLGGYQAFKITAAPTEQPVHWGWSHAPLFGVSLVGNTFEDALAESLLGVEHGPFIKRTSGRVYLSAAWDRNLIAWSAPFRPRSQTAVSFGEAGSLDPNEMLLTLGSTSADARNGQIPALALISALVNGTPASNQIRPLGMALPAAAPTGVHLLVDTGISATDRRTRDGRIAFEPGAGTARSQYSLNGGPWLDVPDPRAFLPSPLVEGTNTIAIRGLNAANQPSPGTLFQFQLDRSPPALPSVTLLSSDGLLDLKAPDAESELQYALGEAGFFLAAPTSGAFRPPDLLPGWNTIQIRASDLAGNTSPPVVIRTYVRSTTPTGYYRGQLPVDRVGRRSLAGPDGYRDMVFRIANLPAELSITSIKVEGQGADVWASNVDPGAWRADVVPIAASTQADVLLQPARVERGRRFLFTINYEDGSVDRVWIQGGSARPTLRMPRAVATPIDQPPSSLPKPRRGIRFHVVKSNPS